jgi:rubredoxin
MEGMIQPPPDAGPHAVVTLLCGWCGLVYDESATTTPQVLARPDLPRGGQPAGAHGCPRCGTRQDQATIGRSER